MIRTPEDAAVLIAVLFKRAGHKRARVSVKTIKRVSGRNYLRRAFLDMLAQRLDDLGFILIELDRGGYGLIPSSALDGAPAITVKRHLEDDLRRLTQKKVDIGKMRAELEEHTAADDDE